MEVAKPLQMRAYDDIKSRIVGDRLEYGTIYSETKLAAEIGISRTPVRDAIHRLAQEGFVDIIPSKGFSLRRMSRQDIEDTYQVRCAIESFCTMLIARETETKKAQALFTRLERTLEALERIATGPRDVDEFYEHDQAFHNAIVDYADNQAFTQLFGSYIHKIKRLAVSTLKRPERMETTLLEHRAMLEAMRRGDIHDVYQATLAHMEAPKNMSLRELGA